MTIGLHLLEIVAKINVLNDGNVMISDCNETFYLSSVNSLHEMTFLGLHVVSMLGNIVSTLGE